jgi:hypothetical protein
MRICGLGLLGALNGLIWQGPALAQAPAVPIETHFEMYAAGIHVANIDTEYAIGVREYQMHTEYHTTGLVSLFNHGHSDQTVNGLLTPTAVRPGRLFIHGEWRGEPRLADIEFSSGTPAVLQLAPADTQDRGPVPQAMLTGSIDNLSAMVNLMRTVGATGGCNISVRAFDGHKVTDFETRTGGMDTLQPSYGSIFSGPAMRCDFVGSVIAGAKRDDPADARATHGSTWLARLTPGALPQPVRMSFESRWFGNAVMYLMASGPVPGAVVARSR